VREITSQNASAAAIESVKIKTSVTRLRRTPTMYTATQIRVSSRVPPGGTWTAAELRVKYR
jgi:hypothetical protein